MAIQDGRNITLPEVIDLDTLDSIRDKLLDAVESGSVTIAAGGVERVSTNALLMLISAAETARRNSFEFTIDGVSPVMLAAVDRLGLGGHFSGMMKQ
jgi:anti-anti-sigma regulatory factor